MRSKLVILALLLFALLFVSVCCEQQQDHATEDDDSFWNEVIDFSETEQQSTINTAQSVGDDHEDEDFSEFENEFGLKVDTASQPDKSPQSTSPASIDSAKTTATGTLELNTTESSGFRFFSLPEQEHYYYEIVAIAGLLAYTAMYFIGRRQNQNIAKAWATAFAPDFCANFSSAAADNAFQITRDSAYEFRYYATGRLHCSGILCTLQLKSRHDLPFWLYGYIYGEEDIITIEVPLTSEMENYTMAVVPRLKTKEYKQSYNDLRNFASVVPVEALTALSVLSDSPDMARSLIEENGVAAFLNQHSRHIIAIHVSDCYQPYIDPQNPFAPPIVGNACKGHVLKVVLRLPGITDSTKMKAEFGKLMSFVFWLIDAAVTTKLTPRAKERVARVRDRVREEHEKLAQKAKQENILKKRQEKKRKEEEEKRLALFKTK